MTEKTRPPRRRWRIVAAGSATALALAAGGWATANAASADKPPAPKQTFQVLKGQKGVPAVVKAADEFLALLTDDQKADVLLDFTSANATAWSNLPCGGSCRPGIELGTLTETQLAAAEQVVQIATGTGTGTGYDQITKILEADDVLAAAQGTSTGGPGGTPPSDGTPPSGGAPPSGGGGGPAGGGYGSGLYYLAFLGTPSNTGTWQLHFGGHHLALNLTYAKGKVTGTTPFFLGVEPTSFTDSGGNTVEALKPEHDAMLALAQSLTTTQLTTAKVSESFSDVLLGPSKDGQFPATKEGIKVSSLPAKQKKLVLAAVRPWVAAAADADAARIERQYAAQLNQTYVAVSGNQTLASQGDYVRIDGPGVWIEFVCQNGVVFRNQIHYHTVYRDHTSDYGGEFSF